MLICKIRYFSIYYVFDSRRSEKVRLQGLEVTEGLQLEQAWRWTGSKCNTLAEWFIMRTLLEHSGEKWEGFAQDHDKCEWSDGHTTYIYNLTKILVDMFKMGKYEYYHTTNEEGYIM